MARSLNRRLSALEARSSAASDLSALTDAELSGLLLNLVEAMDAEALEGAADVIRAIAADYEIPGGADRDFGDVVADLKPVLADWACGRRHLWEGWTDGRGNPLQPRVTERADRRFISSNTTGDFPATYG